MRGQRGLRRLASCRAVERLQVPRSTRRSLQDEKAPVVQWRRQNQMRQLHCAARCAQQRRAGECRRAAGQVHNTLFPLVAPFLLASSGSRGRTKAKVTQRRPLERRPLADSRNCCATAASGMPARNWSAAPIGAASQVAICLPSGRLAALWPQRRSRRAVEIIRSRCSAAAWRLAPHPQ